MRLSEGLSVIDQALLSDPQTSGGLLVTCAPETVADVLAIFARHGFACATEIGEVLALEPGQAPHLVVG